MSLREEISEIISRHWEEYGNSWETVDKTTTNEILSRFEKLIDEHLKSFQEFDQAIGGDVTSKAGMIALLGLKEELK